MLTDMARSATYAGSKESVWGPTVEVGLVTASDDECTRLWHGPCGGSDQWRQHFVVSSQLRGGLPNVDTLMHVTVTATSHLHYCPNMKTFKEASRSVMGSVRHFQPKVFRLHVTKPARVYHPKVRPSPETAVNQVLVSSSVNELEGRVRKKLRSDGVTAGREHPRGPTCFLQRPTPTTPAPFLNRPLLHLHA